MWKLTLLSLLLAFPVAAQSPVTKSQAVTSAIGCPGNATLVGSGVDTNSNKTLDDQEIIVLVVTCEGNDYRPKTYNILSSSNCDYESCDLSTSKGFTLRLSAKQLVLLKDF